MGYYSTSPRYPFPLICRKHLLRLPESNGTLELEAAGASLVSNGEELDWDNCWWGSFRCGGFNGLDFEVVFFSERHM
jgi:hypothetical protein